MPTKSILTAAVAIALVISLGGSQSASAGPGQCPDFTAAVIDDTFTAWATETAFNPLFDSVTCTDSPATPEIYMNFIVPITTNFVPNYFSTMRTDRRSGGPVA